MEGNPYNYRSPIKDPADFLGRSVLLNRAVEFIQDRACLSLVGEPNAGLTSLLWYMTSDLFLTRFGAQGRQLCMVYVDCAELHDPLPIIQHVLNSVAPDRPVPDIPNWRSLQGRLIRTLSSMRQQEQRRVVILFDDFEWLGARSEAFEFLESLRALAQSPAETTLITATRKLLKDCCHADVLASPFPNIFRPIYVAGFTADECAEFIRATSARSGVDLTPYSEQIVALAGTFPYFLQMACFFYYEAVRRGEAPGEETAALFVRTARPDFDRLWDGLGEGEKRSLRALAAGGASGGVDQDLVNKGYVVGARIFSTAFAEHVARMA